MASEVTRVQFRLGSELTSVVSAAQATALIGKEIPLTTAGNEPVMGKVIEVTTGKDGTQVTMEIELPIHLKAMFTAE